MSNIHTLAEYRDDYGENLPFNRRYYQSQSSFIQRSKPIDVVNLIFPHFTWKSFIMAISIIQIIVFIMSISIKPADFLTPSALGANVAAKIKQGEIHRLILPIFLHANVFHTFFNVFFQLRMGFTLEKNYGILKIMILYFVSGIYGNILSSAVTYCPIKVGASTSGMGLLGVVTSELILLWHIIRHRERVVFNIIFFSLISFFYYFTFNGSNIDHVGHLGGLLSGISIGVLYNNQMENKPSWYDHMKMASYASLALLAVVPPIVLLTVPRSC
ncbi:rhomboid protease ROM1, putative [Plasmodium ovale]|uniref:Rhomboid-like protease n=1 Tax=Plasmodium ovale TaxID=36330 RepID=A0A1D3THQ5_PLAOA|nr:rhomboid protease ROM1, putative [Plasmodium ovale]